ncbi:hypothetical protein [Staphylococcus aureus]|uniref:hypothetical protein n=1 Tax=Staphylococcus aureus TaxID=1280 RepID=UPI0018E96F90|nr:hypothetical protein [Staphylococcus aureus]MBJ6141284.1 hypothetical protein [Staphylococcus aureus]MBJ6151960.1 hypothetical protein [Staphylococcus aureus]MBJ6154167.1 hypothetical protein [Staphylococcus aureus]MBJ6156954.1 hypothetical protein [Staphylococcus aureus]MBJ6159636.1 hypothetical protein [Staphylococcus aureus]
MKPHKFKRMAIDLIERVDTEGYRVEYSHNAIWFIHVSEKYPNGNKHLYLFNNTEDDKTLLMKFEKVKKVISGEALIND